MKLNFEIVLLPFFKKLMDYAPAAEFIDPWMGDGGPVWQPYAGVDLSPQSGSMNCATESNQMNMGAYESGSGPAFGLSL